MSVQASRSAGFLDGLLVVGRRVGNYLFRSSPQRLLVSSFLLAILAGTGLLLLPWSHLPGRVGFLDALFTSTSAVCVTGLVVVDTGTDYTRLGQFVILALIQLGGLGIMTFAALAFKLGGLRLPLFQQAALEDSIFQQDVAAEFSRAFRRVLRTVAAVEGLGALLLFAGMLGEASPGEALYSAVFHSVSAFCNAGFALYRDSLCSFRGNPLVVTVVMLLIVLGGLGHTVMLDLQREVWRVLRRGRPESPHRFSLHTRVVLLTSALLIAAGAALLAAFDPKDTGETGFLAGALFQSVTARTAGFNTVDISAVPLPGIMVLVLLMFIGGSPGSCAGGIKTTSLAIWIARMRSALLGREEVTLLGRTIPAWLVLRAVALMGLALLWNGVGVLVLSVLQPEGTSLREIVFEQVSAFSTVGLSTGLTGELVAGGRLWIVLTMFVGRLGPLTLVFSFLTTARSRVGYPQGRIMIG